MREWKKSFERGARSPIGLQMRIDRAMDVVREHSRELDARIPRRAHDTDCNFIHHCAYIYTTRTTINACRIRANAPSC